LAGCREEDSDLKGQEDENFNSNNNDFCCIRGGHRASFLCRKIYKEPGSCQDSKKAKKDFRREPGNRVARAYAQKGAE
jgi:hypothetical protein